MKHKHKKIIAWGLSAALMLPWMAGMPVQAWGPNRPTYTNEKPADHAVFNSITNNAAVGDERDFVRIEEKSSGRPYTSEIEVEAGKQYEVYIYYHNDASATFNDKAHNYVGIARDVRLASSFPHELKAGERAAVTGKITSTNTNPAAVWDEAYVTAKEDMTLHYVTGSAKIYNSHETNGSILSTSLFSSAGTFLGFKELNGVIFGCDEYSGQVVYTIQTQAVDSPDEPEPDEPEPDEPEPDDPVPDEPIPDEPKPEPEPEVPSELPETGPAEIVLAVIIALSLLAGGIYWYRTHNAVQKATKRAKGRK